MMLRRVLFFIWGLTALGMATGLRAETQAFDEAALEFFEKQVRPILVARCYECHSAKSEEPKGGLRLDSRAAMLAGGDTGPAIDLAAPKESLLLDAVNYGDLYQMPPKSKMPAEEIAILARWVEQGAPWPPENEETASLMKREFDLQALEESHWAWRPVRSMSPPQVQDASWPLQGLDHFILARLEEKGLKPAPPADHRALIRRIFFDLIGLPPTPEEVDQFTQSAIRDPQSAIESLVDRLLASPQFGERWGRHWLDLVRYAESRGHEFDYDVPGAYHYRDYVIRALNADTPYDQFVIEHFAGDLLENPRLHPTEGFNESILGTGFWFFGEWVHSPVDIRQDEADRLDNMLDVASKTFLGMTVACARCHDHKFDAISQHDYYALAGFLQSSSYRQVRFESLEHNARVAAEWERLQREARPKIARAAAESRQKIVDQLATYLLAAQEVAKQATSLDAAATKHGVDAGVLARWVEQLAQAQRNPRDPFHAFSIAIDHTTFADRRASLLEQSEAQSRRAAEVRTHVQTIIDYAAARPQDWIADGPTFGAGPVSAGTLVLSDQLVTPIATVAEYAAARRDPLWNALKLAPGAANEPGRSGAWVRAGRTLRTPTFIIEDENAYYLVRGSGHVYAVVDSHRVNNGPLHGSLIQGFQNVAEPKWIAHPLSRYRGHRAHLEFSARDDATLEVLRVVQGDRPPGDVLDRPNALLTKAIAEAETPEELANNYQAAFQQVLKSLRDNRIMHAAAPDDEARLANWILEHPELTTGEASPETVSPAARDFFEKRQRLATRIKYESHTAPAMWDGSSEDEFLLIRGNPRAPAERVPRRLLEALAGPEPLACEAGSGRLPLARQIASAENPLTARVMVNRVWHHLFGRGIVASVDNFGVLGEKPSHPELLDYLTMRFIDEGWSVKRLIRTLVLSRTYQMSSQPLDAAAEEADPTNMLLHRMRLRRLQGETIRDAILAVSGRLDLTMYGPSVPVHLTPFMQGRGRPAKSGPLDGAGRRSIYGAVRRNFLPPMMLAFDTPAPFSTMGRRNVSNVPAQALILMNDPFVIEQARRWAERELANQERSAEEHIERLYVTAFARPPRPEESAAALAFLDQQAAELRLPPESASSDVRVWMDLCHVLFNVKEFVFTH